ncbi:hypothetical protein [Haliangium ochraceum]|uniref:Uncharacterized protein n=1 Tax=Haliangium ochraceum (strain DSM 14365 / JCM 11303 / SMP-2) TaxID=502025 RepID=D0LKV1_HALO1|nr:hypothetical protein [Haliangium ochraceum]ACY16671.1 conserved hypothetical protein [Haliangium ochraceum DSM 14365]
MSDQDLPSASDDFDLATRELCADGGCIGLVGPDGFCKECGKPGLGPGLDPRQRGLLPVEDEPPRPPPAAAAAALAAADNDADDDADADDDDEQVRGGAAAEPGGPELAPDDFDERELCPDGACIGVLDAQGVCRSCGTRAQPAPA